MEKARAVGISSARKIQNMHLYLGLHNFDPDEKGLDNIYFSCKQKIVMVEHQAISITSTCMHLFHYFLSGL